MGYREYKSPERIGEWVQALRAEEAYSRYVWGFRLFYGGGLVFVLILPVFGALLRSPAVLWLAAMDAAAMFVGWLLVIAGWRGLRPLPRFLDAEFWPFWRAVLHDAVRGMRRE